jgi:hypothetical protein
VTTQSSVIGTPHSPKFEPEGPDSPFNTSLRDISLFVVEVSSGRLPGTPRLSQLTVGPLLTVTLGVSNCQVARKAYLRIAQVVVARSLSITLHGTTPIPIYQVAHFSPRTRFHPSYFQFTTPFSELHQHQKNNMSFSAADMHHSTRRCSSEAMTTTASLPPSPSPSPAAAGAVPVTPTRMAVRPVKPAHTRAQTVDSVQKYVPLPTASYAGNAIEMNGTIMHSGLRIMIVDDNHVNLSSEFNRALVMSED